MKEINGVLKQENEILDSQIIKILDEVCENGDSMIIKSDGMRTSLKYTVVITSSKEGFDAIRFDGETLREAIIKTLKEYVKYISN